METRTVYRHPQGRYEVQERRGKGALGGEYRIREAILTPEKDRRGRAADALTDGRQPRAWHVRKDEAKSKKFSVAEEREVAAMWRQGFGIPYIARTIGRSSTGVNHCLQRLGLREPMTEITLRQEEVDKAVAMWNEGKSIRAIAETLGRGYTTIRTALRRQGRMR